MCGISGIVARRRVNTGAVEAMNALMRHRGPDGEGVWQSADGQVVTHDDFHDSGSQAVVVTVSLLDRILR